MLKIKYNTLADLFASVILSFNNQKVLLEVTEDKIQSFNDIILVKFFEESVFDTIKSQKNIFSFSALETSFKTLNSLCPNLVYNENIYYIEEKKYLKDLANNFKSKGFRQIHEVDTNIFSDKEYALNKGHVLKTAPAYRCNLSRLKIALLKTLKNLGSDFIITSKPQSKKFVSTQSTKANYNYSIRKLNKKYSPLDSKTLYTGNGNYLFHRCNDFYISSFSEVLTEYKKTYNFEFPEDEILETIKKELFLEDLPLESYIIAEQKVKQELKKENLKDISSLKLYGSDFEFSPSAPDVMGYSDLQFDLVKRMDINVNDFKNAVFDFGTQIQEIINLTYDLFPEYHNGQKSFLAAIKIYKENELKN